MKILLTPLLLIITLTSCVPTEEGNITTVTMNNTPTETSTEASTETSETSDIPEASETSDAPLTADNSELTPEVAINALTIVRNMEFHRFTQEEINKYLAGKALENFNEYYQGVDELLAENPSIDSITLGFYEEGIRIPDTTNFSKISDTECTIDLLDEIWQYRYTLTFIKDTDGLYKLTEYHFKDIDVE